jgi:hypothetical protein
MPFSVDRWLGGTLTNYETVKRSVAKFKKYQQMETSGEMAKLPRKEESAIKREMGRMQRNFNGIAEMGGLPSRSSSSTSATRRSRSPRPSAADPLDRPRRHEFGPVAGDLSDPRQRRRGQVDPDHRRDGRGRHPVRPFPARHAPRPARRRRQGRRPGRGEPVAAPTGTGEIDLSKIDIPIDIAAVEADTIAKRKPPAPQGPVKAE